ncbi:MAG: methyltransferase family protein [Candidatus Bruticola sp.]
MKIPNENCPKIAPPFIFKWRGLIMAAVTAVILVAAKPTLVACCWGACLATLGELLRSWALGWTGEHTRSQELKASFLVTGGPYKYVRNPLYLGNILNGLGVLVAAVGDMPCVGAVALWIFGILSLYIVYASCIISEEAFLAMRFGDIFFRYRAVTPTILPRWGQYLNFISSFFNSSSHTDVKADGEGFFSWQSLKFEYSTWGWLIAVWSLLLAKIYM